MQKPLLSICIPTYNRSIYLNKALDSIFSQINTDEEIKNLVEVVISDNASTDDTNTIVKKYIESGNKITYTRNEKNVGFDLNVLNVVTCASGDYCWYLGDDDMIVEGGIKLMCSKLASDKYDIVCLNAAPITDTPITIAGVTFNDKNCIEVTEHNDFFFRGFCQGGFSVLVFKRALWLEQLDSKNFLEYWLYYETVIKILPVTKKTMLFIQEPLIMTGQDCRWSENGAELYTFINSNRLIERMAQFGFDKKRIDAFLTKNYRKTILILLRAKGHGLALNKNNLLFIYEHSRHIGIFLLFVVTLIYFIPNNIIVFVRDTKKRLFRKQAI